MKSSYQVHLEKQARLERRRFFLRALGTAILIVLGAFLAIDFVIILWGKG